MSGAPRYLSYGIIFVVVIAASVGYFGGGLAQKVRVTTPHIEPAGQLSPPLLAVHSFPFGNSTVQITVPVNSSVYRGARNADKEITVEGNVSKDTWIADTYRAMVTDPAQDDFFRDLTGKFRSIRTERELSDDQYLELMAVYVQSLRYETIGDYPAKFPVETAMDGAGDCDDKSLLLAGLLSHEGYRVAIFSFGPENHTAIGIGSDNYLFRDTGYAFVETTNYSYVGVPATKLAGGRLLSSDPVVIPIGDGTRLFTSGNETRFLKDTETLTRNRAEEMEPGVKASSVDLDMKRAQIRTIETRMAALKDSGDLTGYSIQAGLHISLVAEYDAELARELPVFLQFKNYADVHNRIASNAFDRKGVFEYVMQNPGGVNFSIAIE